MVNSSKTTREQYRDPCDEHYPQFLWGRFSKRKFVYNTISSQKRRNSLLRSLYFTKNGKMGVFGTHIQDNGDRSENSGLTMMFGTMERKEKKIVIKT